MYTRTRSLGLLAACLFSCTHDSVSPAAPPVANGHDWPMFGVEATRSSHFADSTGITAANVATLRVQQVQLGGTVDAAPIYLHAVQVLGAAHDVFFVTTSYGQTLAIDANAGTILWRFTPPGYAGWVGTERITNTTPVADPDRASVYAASPDGKVERLAVADGHVVWSTAITSRPDREKIASPLGFFRGRVIVVTGGYVGDAPPYQGHVALLDAGSGALLHVWNSLCSDRPGVIDPASCAQSGSAIWGRAGAVVDTTTGNLFVATGNGKWDGATAWGDAVVELDPDATRLLGNFTPSNTLYLDTNDADLGSTSPVLLDATHLVQGGKDAKLRVIDLTRAAGTTAHMGGETQSVGTPSGGELFTAPAVVHANGATTLYVADGSGTAAWTYAGGQLTSLWSNGNPGTSPVVAGGLLYVYDPGGALRVYDPASGHVLTQLQAGGGHWNSPIVADGKIALPEGNANSHATTGVLDIWRLPTTAADRRR